MRYGEWHMNKMRKRQADTVRLSAKQSSTRRGRGDDGTREQDRHLLLAMVLLGAETLAHLQDVAGPLPPARKQSARIKR